MQQKSKFSSNITGRSKQRNFYACFFLYKVIYLLKLKIRKGGGELLKDTISEKIDNMEELDDRTILKAIVRDVFEGLIEYQQEFNARLEERIFNQIRDKESNYDIYTTIVPRDKLKVINDFLVPILNEDEEEPEVTILKDIEEGENIFLEKIFLKMEYGNIMSLRQDDDRFFYGVLYTEDEKYNLKLSLDYNKEYIQEEKKLYKFFLENTISWRTVFNPYSRRIFNVKVVDWEKGLEEVKEFEKIEYDLEEFEDAKFRNYVPVWNVRRVFQKGEGFPVPARNTTNYDHYISVENLDLQNGYLVVPDGLNIISVKKKEDDIIITSDKSNSNPWELIEIIQNPREKEREYEFELFSNSKKRSFVNKMVNDNTVYIKSKADIERIVNSYQEVSGIKLENIEVVNETTAGDTYDYNSFIEDEVREGCSKKILLLTFSTDINNYLKNDILSFVVSEIQMYFSDYVCRGVCQK